MMKKCTCVNKMCQLGLILWSHWSVVKILNSKPTNSHRVTLNYQPFKPWFPHLIVLTPLQSWTTFIVLYELFFFIMNNLHHILCWSLIHIDTIDLARCGRWQLQLCSSGRTGATYRSAERNNICFDSKKKSFNSCHQ